MAAVSIEARVGFFVLGALAVLAGLVLALGDYSLVPGRRLYADFAHAGGLEASAPVKVGGIRVGKVVGLQLLGPESEPPPAQAGEATGRTEPAVVRATLSLQGNAEPWLTEGTRFAVGTEGVFGGSYVELLPGQGRRPALAEGLAVRGLDPPRLHLMMLKGAAMLDGLAPLLGEPERTGLSEAGGALASLLGLMNEVLAAHKGKVGKGIEDLGAAAEDLRFVMHEVRQLFGERGRVPALVADAGTSAASLRQELPDFMRRAKAALGGVEEASVQLRSVLEDERLDSMVALAHKSIQDLEQLSQDARAVAGRIRRGQGTLGGLVQDPQVYDDLKELLRDLKRNPWKVMWRD